MKIESLTHAQDEEKKFEFFHSKAKGKETLLKLVTSMEGGQKRIANERT